MRHALLLLPALVLQAQAPASQAPAPSPLTDRLARVSGLPTDALRGLQAELAVAEAPAEAKAYHEAFLAYHLVTRLRGKEPKAAEAMLDRAVQALEARRDAESRALLAACLGLKIGFRPGSAMSLAPRAGGLLGDARAQAPGSPRVLVLAGVQTLHTPAFYGGGPEKALPILEAAVKAAEAEAAPADPWAPRWGKVEAYGWLAYAQAEAGRADLARAAADKALALDPANGFVRSMVLPKLAAPAPAGDAAPEAR